MTECIAVNIQDMLTAIGEEAVIALLSAFSCPLNESVEKFVRKEAIDFARRKLSVTYLVLKKDRDDRFVLFGDRVSQVDGKRYLQMIKFF
ncbi:MAG: hypothetical protein LUF35_15100 [Lachnospiraceae bacterium]|nr:hypothetical protein [Lachnospiraceae bacterium]